MKTLLIATLLLLMAVPAFAQTTEKHEMFGLTYLAEMGPTISRVMEDWSVGFEFGADIDAGPGVLEVSYELHDILTDEENQVIPWDGTFKMGLKFKF